MRKAITDKVTVAALTAVAFVAEQFSCSATHQERGSNDTSQFGWIWVAVGVVAIAVGFFTGKVQEWINQINGMGWW
ncbi:hypothetical protein [Glutamicibacter nicotianae]|uniref:hypothetical protein n=1 Tax=Glutamicibacter nicotianae TaxID=37929 RepID=UPI000EF92D0C|nr:hypothetical protein [Glutamicibacter nicotianae]